MNLNRFGAVVALALLGTLCSAPAGVTATQQMPAGQIVRGIPRVVASGGPSGHVYIGSSTEVVEVTADGQLVRTLDSIPAPVTALAVDSDGAVYSTRQTGGHAMETEIRKTSADGTLAWTTTRQMVQSGGLAVADGRVWWRGLNSLDSARTTDGSAAPSITMSSRDLSATPGGNLLLSTADGAIEVTPAGAEVRRIPEFRGAIASSPEGHVYGDETSWGPGPGMRLTKFDISTAARSTGQSASTYLVDVAATGDDVVWTVQSDGSSWFLVRLDGSTPDVVLKTSDLITDTNRTITLDASASAVPFGSIRLFEWDLDGDGTFETSTGTEPRIHHRYASRGARSPAVRATSTRGGSAVATVSVDVREGPAAGPVGVSINGGARYTNDPDVTMHLRWPTFAQEFVISNDGGFVPATRAPVVSTYRWRLDGSGPERLPKTIYVRFMGGASGAETYQDDIILDQTRPSIESGAATPTRASNRAASAPRRVFRVRVIAKDKTSGVARMQVTHRKSRPGKWLSYTRSRSYTTSKRTIFVRVQDRAGNVSKWKRLA
ncbi:hypothetical protein [Nocardioides sp. SYSU D00065]|uniref:hypothetical protein n=1 Tax=Nocardioides sp. SYSU D00065 TaxID=2817378 RepID=UPI001B33E296|nr:hypothetical protein [Nocardioides sp. SYSU D00065]